MQHLVRSLMAAMLAIGMTWSAGSLAGEAPIEESLAIHAVVQTQLEALAADDAETAFEMVSDETRALLGSPEALLGIVRDWYPALYRPQKAEFSSTEVVGQNAMQEVAITDSNGIVWIAIFLMALDDAEHWKIDSYYLLETTSMEV